MFGGKIDFSVEDQFKAIYLIYTTITIMKRNYVFHKCSTYLSDTVLHQIHTFALPNVVHFQLHV